MIFSKVDVQLIFDIFLRCLEVKVWHLTFMLFSLLSYQYFAFFQNLLTFMQAKLRHYLLCFDVTSVNLSSLTSHERPTKEKAAVKKICLSKNNCIKNEILHPCPLVRIELGGLHGWIIQVNSVKPPIKSVRWPLKAFAEITCFVKQNILQCIIKRIFCDVLEFTSGYGDIFGTIYVPSWFFLGKESNNQNGNLR